MRRYRFTCAVTSKANFEETAQEVVELEAEDDWWALIEGQKEVQRRRGLTWLQGAFVVEELDAEGNPAKRDNRTP